MERLLGEAVLAGLGLLGLALADVLEEQRRLEEARGALEMLEVLPGVWEVRHG